VLGAAGGTFRGQPADATAVLVRHTLYGDANLDGSVNGTDLSVDGSDFALLAGNFGKTAPGAGGTGLAAGEWEPLEAFGTSIGVPIPQPATAGLLAAGVAGLLARRRRR
jgi:hypothetical protein